MRSQPKTKIILAMVNRYKNPTLFAFRLKTTRERLGISQMELGVRAGIDEGSASARINQYERGKHTPDFQMACLIAKVLNVPPAYFYTENDQLAELVIIFEKLSGVARQDLINFAEKLI